VGEELLEESGRAERRSVSRTQAQEAGRRVIAGDLVGPIAGVRLVLTVPALGVGVSETRSAVESQVLDARNVLDDRNFDFAENFLGRLEAGGDAGRRAAPDIVHQVGIDRLARNVADRVTPPLRAEREAER